MQTVGRFGTAIVAVAWLILIVTDGLWWQLIPLVLSTVVGWWSVSIDPFGRQNRSSE